MGVDQYRDREGDGEERTGVRQGGGRENAGGAVSDDRDAEGRGAANEGWAAPPRVSTPGSSDATQKGRGRQRLSGQLARWARPRVRASW
jgi:hypothetical protein